LGAPVNPVRVRTQVSRENGRGSGELGALVEQRHTRAAQHEDKRRTGEKAADMCPTRP